METLNLQEMIHAHSASIYRLAFAITRSHSDADDVTQEVFISYLRNKPVFENERHARAWFLKVASNASKKVFRNPFYNTTDSFDEAFHNLPKQEQQDYEPLYKAIGKLPKKYRTVIHLFYFEEYSTLEMSEILNINESTLRTQLARARDQLKKFMEEGDDY